MSRIVAGVIAVVMAMSFTAAESAETKLKLAIGQRGNWDTSVAELGQRAGIFRKRGLDLDLLYTQGGGETMQAVISGSVEIGVAAGTLGVLGAFAKGAPVRIIGAQATGAADFWYVRADSRMQTIQDAGAGTTIAFSTNGSSTNSVVIGFVKEYKLNADLVATGGPPATFTAVMSGQVAVGWSSPPFAFEALDQGKIRIVGRANDLSSIRQESIRCLIANASVVGKQKEAITRFMTAYRETVDWMYASDDALRSYADFAQISIDTARRVRDEFFPKSLLDPDRMSGLDLLTADAVAFKNLSQPMTSEQLKTLIQIPPPQ
ncbi:ABC transporter substrate-binding protein [Bradyrhizobium prioriisuperbiae]|uniref:ABC transporter substrate-binding protein n=1 Tax=Bradyrhizobium prioriisuperbiae TaxID=2854389 RepID=UPI0028E52B15|nr:ABC transporter substrate-binding protein [Bradyrhizobium prioritasuperba]